MASVARCFTLVNSTNDLHHELFKREAHAEDVNLGYEYLIVVHKIMSYGLVINDSTLF
jgi:hypothetical protein